MATAERTSGLVERLGGAALALALVLIPAGLRAQADTTSEWFAPPPAESPSRGAPMAPEDVGRDSEVVNPDRGTTFAVAPIPNYNAQFGFGVALVGMAFRKLDDHPETPPSTGMLLGYAAAQLINFVVQIGIVRYLTKSDYGAYAWALAGVLLVQAVVPLGLDRASARFLAMYDERADRPRLLGATCGQEDRHSDRDVGNLRHGVVLKSHALSWV